MIKPMPLPQPPRIPPMPPREKPVEPDEVLPYPEPPKKTATTTKLKTYRG